MGPEVDLFVLQAELVSQIVSVKLYGVRRKAQYFSYFLVCFPFLDKVSSSNLHGCETGRFRRQFTGKRRDNVIQI